MPDQITVQFGGREVVLNSEGRWFHCGWIKIQEQSVFSEYHWLAIYANPNIQAAFVIGHGDTPQAAVDSVEAKLRADRDELNRVLGGRKEGNQ